MEAETLVIQELIKKLDKEIINRKESLALAVKTSAAANELLSKGKVMLRGIGDHLTLGFDNYLIHKSDLEEGWTLLLIAYYEKYEIIGTNPKYMEWNKKIVWCHIHQNEIV